MAIIKIQKILKKHKWIGRSGNIFVPLFVIGYGLIHIYQGRPIYPNYWGGIVFAHFVVGIGFLALFVGIYITCKSDKEKTREKKK